MIESRRDTLENKLNALGGKLKARVTLVEASEGGSTFTVRFDFDDPLGKPKVKAASTLIDLLLEGLDRAEQSPGIEFVALKWFRNTFLDGAGIPEAERQSSIAKAIEAGYIRTGKFQNPRAPKFPTTGIRLNRQSPVVQKAIGAGKKKDLLGFAPVKMKGKPISETILEDRR